MSHKILSCLIFPFLFIILANGQLDYNFYDKSCPNLPTIVRFNVRAALRNGTRLAASLLRLHFHDCLVNGCDGSVLLDDFTGEKNAFPNKNSARGFEVVDNIKIDVERVCPLIVSCVDILTVAAREAVMMEDLIGWHVSLGRRDGITASMEAANNDLPSPLESLGKIIAKFASNGLDLKDVVVLLGIFGTLLSTIIVAHTIGYAQCFTFKRRLFDFKNYGKPDPTLHPSLPTNLQGNCPNVDGSNTKLSPLDASSTCMFDNKNLVNNYGLFESDQALMLNPRTAAMVNDYSNYPYLFSRDFAASMVKLNNIGVLTGKDGQFRKKCGFVNRL